MSAKVIDLSLPEHSYLFGFLQGDGTLFKQKSRQNDGRGRLSVEISEKDGALLYRFQSLFPVYSSITPRLRDTNFKEDYRSLVWTVCDQALRLDLIRLGIPVGRKSGIVKQPTEPHLEDDYWRGLLDADGSVGFRKDGVPFLSFVTSSDYIALAYLDYLYATTGKRKTAQRNERDGVYNIQSTHEAAQELAERVYYPGALCLERKRKEARRVAHWVRPVDSRRKPSHLRWLPYEDEILLRVGAEEAVELLEGRSLSATKARLYRFEKKKKSTQRTSRVVYAGMDPAELDAWNLLDAS